MIYILARSFREADWIARRFGMRRGDWRYLQSPERELRGLRRPYVIQTRCYVPRDMETFYLLRRVEARVAIVDC